MLSSIARHVAFITASFGAALLYLAAREQSARRAARAAQSAQFYRQSLKIKDAQDEAFATASHSRSDLLERLRKGAF